MAPNQGKRGGQQAPSADSHIHEAQKALKNGERLRDDLKRSCKDDKKHVHQTQALQRQITDTKAGIKTRSFVIKAAAEMTQRRKAGAKTYLSTAKAKQNEQIELLRRLNKKLVDRETSWTKYYDARKKGRKDRLEKLVKEVQKVQYHAMQASNLESPAGKVLSLLQKSEALLSGPYQPAKKFPTSTQMWRESRRNYTIDPRHWAD